MPFIPNKKTTLFTPEKRVQKRSEKVKDYDTKEFRDYSRNEREKAGKCQKCGREFLPKYLILDHIIPVEEGGSFWDRRNHQVLCKWHHSSKTAKEMRTGSQRPFDLNELGEKIPKQTNA